MNPITTAHAMRAFEEAHFAAGTATPEALMLAAGTGAAELFLEFRQSLPDRECRRVVILAGHGNNGGDGIVMAQCLAERIPLPVELFLTAEPDKLSGVGRSFLAELPEQVIVHHQVTPVFQPGDTVIDALLGTGLSGALREPYRSWIAALNAAEVPVFSVDLPSGLGADLAVRADRTAAIGFFKDILFSGEGAACAGTLRRVPLPLSGAPDSVGEAVDAAALRQATRRIDNTVHKYRKGSVLLLGGSRDYPFAPFLSARSALRAGAGLVRLLIPENCPFPGGVPAGLIVRPLPADAGCFDRDYDDLPVAYSAKADLVAAGPGLGRNPATAALIARLCRMEQPLLLDADGLFFASQMASEIRRRTAPTLLTPHWGEARILAEGAGITLPDDDPDEAARELAEAYHSHVILKGRFTRVAAPGGRVVTNTSGSPALATAGSGDCLTGVAAAFLAQTRGENMLEQASLAVFLHGLTGELAAQRFNTRGVIADDLADLLPEAWRSVTFRA